MSELSVCSFNCRNLKSSIDEIRKLCNSCDILMLQETWLLDIDLQMLNAIHEDFYASGTTSMNTTDGLLTGRPHGGLAILWRKSIAQFCRIQTYSDNRILGIELSNSQSKSILLLNVYLPYNCDANVDSFLQYLGKIDNIVDESETPYVFIIGDFNADLSTTNGEFVHKFGKELFQYSQSEGLVISDIEFLSNDSFTYVSEAHGTTSWLDHLVTTVNGHSLITDMSIVYDCITSDHRPLCVKVALDDIKLEPSSVPLLSCSDSSVYSIKWQDVNTDDINHYTEKTKVTLSAVELNHSLLLCDDPCCKDVTHINAIDRMYNDMITALKEASEHLTCKKKDGFRQIPGWNECCQEVHAIARDAFLTWVANGKPRSGFWHDNMKRTRAQFKLALRQCKNDKSTKAADSLAKKLLTKSDSRSFWKEVKQIGGNNKAPLASTVGGATGNNEICLMWQHYYQDLLNSCKDKSKMNKVLQYINSNCEDMCNVVTYCDVEKVIKNLKDGKSNGMDGIYSEHFKYADKKINCILKLCFNAMFMHGYIPPTLMDTIIIPLVKDNKGDITDRDNYRPIALTCVSSKILELLILDKYGSYMQSNDNQFGFKQNHATDHSVFIFKEVVDYYTQNSSPVYVCFLDASKAFDRVNHWFLFDKLMKKNVPKFVLRLMTTWYSTQKFYVRWGTSLSDSFTVSNGVRQGGILSPILFNMFVNDLSLRLNDSGVGCCMNNVFINHVNYADDSVLIAPSPTALQTLIKVCEVFARENDMCYNIKKTVCMCFRPKQFRSLCTPDIFLNNMKLQWVATQKYLGVMICDNFLDDTDIKRQLRAIYASGNMLCRKFKMCSKEVKIQLFKSYCTNLYCSHLWQSYSKKSYHRVRVAYNNIYRSLMGIDRQCSISNEFVNASVNNFGSLIRNAISGFRKRIYTIDNTLVSTVVNSLHFLYSSFLNKKWKELVFLL